MTLVVVIISSAQEPEAPCSRRQYPHEEGIQKAEGLPQYPEGRTFDSSTCRCKSDCTFWTDREEVGVNPCSQFVDSEDAALHGDDAGG